MRAIAGTLLVSPLSTTACAQDRTCVGESSLGIVGGEPGGAPAGQLHVTQIAAIGALQSSPDVQSTPEGVFCTGTLIAPRWVLGAAHCLLLDPQWFGSDVAGQALAVRILRTFPHPERDVALFELAVTAELDAAGVRPIPLLQGNLGQDWVGREATLVGLGMAEEGRFGERRFAVETIAAVSNDELVVNGGGVSGACRGDSGGPLLVSTPAELVGVLSSGSNSCVELDRYERVDRVIAWIRATIAAERDPCAGLDWEGACAPGGGGPMWCADGELATEECVKEQTACGYDATARGYRCVAPELDPCRGIGREPECMGGTAIVRCERGMLVRTDCDCGKRCVIDDRAVCR